MEKILLDIFERRIESILFMHPTGVSRESLLNLLSKDESLLQTVVENLNKSYESINSWLRIKNIGGTYQMVLRDDVEDVILEKYRSSAKEPSASVLETLSVIAYRQPISRSQIDAIRGMNTNFHLKYLINLGWISYEGTESSTYLYKTTDLFLKSFDLQSLEDLPQINTTSQYHFIEQQV